jgi:hypothetical protein
VATAGGGLGGGVAGAGGAGGGLSGLLKGALRIGAGIGLGLAGDELANMGYNGPDKGTTAGGIERVGGSLAKIMGAFAMGGPVLGAIALAVETVNTGLDTLNVIKLGQAQLQEKADSAAGHSADRALGELRDLNKHLSSRNFLEQAAEDTVGGKQIADGLVNLSHATAQGTDRLAERITLLKEAQVHATVRGNQKAADEIGRDIAKLQRTTTNEGNQQQRATDRLRAAVKEAPSRSEDLLTSIRNQPTKISVTVPVSTSVSVRDVETTTRTSSRYGFQAS